jgi:Tfp pilus assembly protein PilF
MHPRNTLKILIVVLLLIVIKNARGASNTWTRISTPHFRVYTDSDEKEALALAEQFERACIVYKHLFPEMNIELHDPLYVVAIRGDRAADELMPATKSGNETIFGYFLPSHFRNYVILRLDTNRIFHFEQLYQAYSEVQFSGYGAGYPQWIDLGMEDFYLNSKLDGPQLELGFPSPAELDTLRHSKLIPLAQLMHAELSGDLAKDAAKRQIYQAESSALLHLLLQRDYVNKTSTVEEYIKLTCKHEDPVNAASSLFGDLTKLDADLSAYVNSAAYKAIVQSNASDLPAHDQFKVETLGSTDLDILRADDLAQQGKLDESQRLIDSVIKRSPDSLPAYEVLAGNAIRSGNKADARKYLAEAVKRGENNAQLLYRYAELIYQSDHSKDAGKEMITVLRKADETNPNLPQVCDLLANLLLLNSSKTDEPKSLEQRAIQLDPAVAHYHMTLAAILVIEGKLDDATREYQQAKNISTDKAEMDKIDEKLKIIQKYQTAAPIPMASPETQPKTHPAELASGPQHEADGVIHHVKCSYPSLMELELQADDKTYKLYHFNYFKIDFNAEDQNVSDRLEPCHTIEGMKAHVAFAEVNDKTVDGQIVSILLK